MRDTERDLRDLDRELEEYEAELEREYAAAESGEFAERAPSGPSLADELIDQLIPDRVDWRRLVRDHPWPAVGLAAVGGYFLGRTRGRAVLAALSAFAAGAVADGVNEALGEEIL